MLQIHYFLLFLYTFKYSMLQMFTHVQTCKKSPNHDCTAYQKLKPDIKKVDSLKKVAKLNW